MRPPSHPLPLLALALGLAANLGAASPVPAPPTRDPGRTPQRGVAEAARAAAVITNPVNGQDLPPRRVTTSPSSGQNEIPAFDRRGFITVDAAADGGDGGPDEYPATEYDSVKE